MGEAAEKIEKPVKKKRTRAKAKVIPLKPETKRRTKRRARRRVDEASPKGLVARVRELVKENRRIKREAARVVSMLSPRKTRRRRRRKAKTEE